MVRQVVNSDSGERREAAVELARRGEGVCASLIFFFSRVRAVLECARRAGAYRRNRGRRKLFSPKDVCTVRARCC